MEKQYKEQVAAGEPSSDLAFSYACHLIKSGFKNDIRKGIAMMESEGEREGGRKRGRVGERKRGREGGKKKEREGERDGRRKGEMGGGRK